MKIYLAGPMRNLPSFNFPAFHAATKKLRALGHEVFSPAEQDLQDGFNPSGDGSDELIAVQGFSLRAALHEDLSYICQHADVLVMLPGWEKSLGARAEAFTAWTLRLPVFSLASFLANSRGPASQLHPGVLNVLA